MFIILLFGLGYILTDGTFGVSLIHAFNWVNTWYWVGIIILGVIMTLMTFATALAGSKMNGSWRFSKIGAISGFLLGGGVSFIVLGVMSFYLFITYYIMDHIPRTAQSWADIPEKTQFAIYLWIFVTIVNMIRRALNKDENKKCEVKSGIVTIQNGKIIRY